MESLWESSLGYVKKPPFSMVTEEHSRRIFQVTEYSRRRFQDLKATGLVLAVYGAMQFGGYVWAETEAYSNYLVGEKGVFIRRL